MRRVLHLIETGGPGGAETVFLELASGLASVGWEPVVAVPWKGWLYETLCARGLAPRLLPTHGSFDVHYLLGITGLLRRERIDLVQAHLLAPAVYGSVAAVLAGGVPVVSTFHGTPDVVSGTGYRSIKFRIVDRRVNRSVFVSESLRQSFLATHPLSPGRTRVIYNGIDAGVFRPGKDASLRNELGIGAADVLVGAVGNIRTPKAYPVLLRAAAILRQRGRPYHFAIVGEGEGSLLQELLQLRRDLGLDDAVTFTGLRSRVDRIMLNFDLYVLSSSSEGFSLTTVQAMACGLPVVATRCGGPEEIIDDGVTGLLVPPESPESLADAIDRLIADPGARARMGRAARERVEERFTLDAMIANYAGLYQECLGGR